MPKSIVCDDLKAGVAKPLWFEPTLNATFAALAEHYDTTVLPTRLHKPRDKAKVELAVEVVERWILARLKNRRFFSLGQLNAAIRALLAELNDRPMRHLGKTGTRCSRPSNARRWRPCRQRSSNAPNGRPPNSTTAIMSMSSALSTPCPTT